jgi:hemolysin activation/secretion protein
VAAPRFVTLTAGVAYEHNTIDHPIGEDESIFISLPVESLYGALDQTEFARLEIGGRIDLSRFENFQQRGFVVGAEGHFYHGVNNTDSDFRLLSGFAHTYLPINPQQLLAVRVVSQIARSAEGSAIPFYHLSSLGGSRSALGFPSNRFVDNDMVSIMSEYRFEVGRELHSRMRAETFLFFHYGAVGERLGQIQSGDWHPSYGLGVRLSQPTMLIGVAYLGFSSEGMTAGIRTSWPF